MVRPHGTHPLARLVVEGRGAVGVTRAGKVLLLAGWLLYLDVAGQEGEAWFRSILSLRKASLALYPTCWIMIGPGLDPSTLLTTSALSLQTGR